MEMDEKRRGLRVRNENHLCKSEKKTPAIVKMQLENQKNYENIQIAKEKNTQVLTTSNPTSGCQ